MQVKPAAKLARKPAAEQRKAVKRRRPRKPAGALRAKGATEEEGEGGAKGEDHQPDVTNREILRRDPRKPRRVVSRELSSDEGQHPEWRKEGATAQLTLHSLKAAAMRRHDDQVAPAGLRNLKNGLSWELVQDVHGRACEASLARRYGPANSRTPR